MIRSLLALLALALMVSAPARAAGWPVQGGDLVVRHFALQAREALAGGRLHHSWLL